MKKSYSVTFAHSEMRIDKWIRINLGNLPQGLIENNLRKGKIKLNNKKIKSSTRVKFKDFIDIYNVNYKENDLKKKVKFSPTKKELKQNEDLIIENNDDFVVLNKPSGISVQGGTKSKKNLIDIFAKSKLFDNSKPYSVHRLDKDTSGIFVISKNLKSAQLLTSLFRLRKIHKTYLAICEGELIKNSGEINNNLIKFDKDKKVEEKAITFYKVLDKNSSASLVSLKPITGRKHQLRKHLFYLGNPIYGDVKYNFNKNSNLKYKKLMLHAYQIKFMINKKKYTFKADLPIYFKNLLKSKRLKNLN